MSRLSIHIAKHEEEEEMPRSRSFENTLGNLNGLLDILGEDRGRAISNRNGRQSRGGHHHNQKNPKKSSVLRKRKRTEIRREPRRGRNNRGRVADRKRAKMTPSREIQKRKRDDNVNEEEEDDFDSFMNASEDGENEITIRKDATPCILPAYQEEYEIEMHDMEHETDNGEPSSCFFCKYENEIGRGGMNELQKIYSRIMETLQRNMSRADKEELYQQSKETWKQMAASVLNDKGIEMEEWKITDLRKHFGSIANPKMHYIDPELIAKDMVRIEYSVVMQIVRELGLKDSMGNVSLNYSANAALGRAIRNTIWVAKQYQYFIERRTRLEEKNARNRAPGEDFFSGGNMENNFVSIPSGMSDLHKSTFYDDFDD